MIDEQMEKFIDEYKEWSDTLFKKYKEAKKEGHKKKIKKLKETILMEMECAIDDSESGLMRMEEKQTTIDESSYRVYFLRKLMEKHEDEIPEHGWDTLKEMEKNVPSTKDLTWETMELWVQNEYPDDWEAGTEEEKKEFYEDTLKLAWGSFIRDVDSLAWYPEIYDKFAKEDAFKVQRLEFVYKVLKEVI